MKFPLSPIFLLASIVVGSSCGQLSPSTSSLEYAHSPGNRILGTPIGHLEILRSGMSNNFGDRLKICVESEKTTISNASLLMETKLAYVMWLKSAGYSAVDFSKFEFFLSSKCNRQDLSIMTSIVIADSSNAQVGEEYNTLFSPAAISCQALAGSFRCSSDGGITLGWGAAASLSHSYFVSNPEKWSNISRNAQGFAILSQYVDWTSLPAGIDGNPQLQGAVGESLKAKYSHLLTLENQNFEALAAYASELEAAQAVSGEDTQFQSLFQQSAQAGSSISSVTYRPKYAAFHVLLHEIGHTFGMMHADNPKGDSVTGASATTTLDPITRQYSTPISTMAYADQYVYLTADDSLGISSVAKTSRSEVALHK